MSDLQKYQMLIGGEWVDASDGQTFESMNPYTGENWASFPRGTADDADRAVQAARKAFNSGDWANMTATQRGHLLRKLGDLIAAKAEDLARLHGRELGAVLRIAEEGACPDTLAEVPQLGLGDLMARTRPHVVIMDIEGAEEHLFEAPWPGHVRHVMMELHPGRYADSVIKRIVDCMSDSDLTYDPGPSRGRILCFRRVRGA